MGEPGPCSFVYFLQEIHKKIRAWPKYRMASPAQRVAIREEEQRNGRGLGCTADRHEEYGACDDDGAECGNLKPNPLI